MKEHTTYTRPERGRVVHRLHVHADRGTNQGKLTDEEVVVDDPLPPAVLEIELPETFT